MEFNLKSYDFIHINYSLKKTYFFFFFNGVPQNSEATIKTNQVLINLNMKYHKIWNKTSNKKIKSSIYKSFNCIIHGITLLCVYNVGIHVNNIAFNKTILFSAPNIQFLALKMNLKIYSLVQLIYLISFYYSQNSFIFYASARNYLITNFSK